MQGIIAQDLKAKLNSNQHTIFITDADDLLAVWRFKRQSATKRSKNLSMVPTKWRMSAPPSEKAPLKPCHVSIRRKAGQTFNNVDFGSTMDCHGHGTVKQISIKDLDTLPAVGLAKQNVAPYVSPVLDTGTLALVCKDLGITGRAIPKVIKGRQYIAFSGYAGLRTLFPGTIYSASNRKIIKMGIGALGLGKMAVKGAKITIVLGVSLTIAEAFFSDHATLYDMFGDIAFEVGQVLASSAVGYFFGLVVGAWTTVAIGPIAAFIMLSVGTGLMIEWADKKYQLTEKLSAMLEDMSKQIERSAKNKANDIERGLYQGIREFIGSQGGYRGPF